MSDRDNLGTIGNPINLNFEDAPQPDDDKAFQGHYQTILRDKDLVIPSDYEDILKDGGVITAGLNSNLMIFGKAHWGRMMKFISKQMDEIGNRQAVIKHVYNHAVEFDSLKQPGAFITLTDDLINYAKLKDEVVMVGVIYYAEVYDKATYTDAMLSQDEIRRLSAAIR